MSDFFYFRRLRLRHLHDNKLGHTITITDHNALPITILSALTAVLISCCPLINYNSFRVYVLKQTYFVVTRSRGNLHSLIIVNYKTYSSIRMCNTRIFIYCCGSIYVRVSILFNKLFTLLKHPA